MEKFTAYYFSLLLLTTSIGANVVNDSSVEEHRVPRVSGRIVKVYSGNRPEPYVCNSEGYKSDPNSCASFYRCVKERNGKFNVFRYQCAPGTIFDPDLETCNHPRSTRRTECGGVGGIETIPSVYATLVNEIDSQKELPRPINKNELAFIQDATIATHPTTLQWLLSESVSTAKPLRTTFHKTQSPSFYPDTTKYNALSTKQPFTSKIEDWTKATSEPKVTTGLKSTNICSDDGFTGDTENCRKFYRCVGNQRGGFYKYEFFCSESTVWDEEIQSCNHPWAVKRSKCGRSISFADNSKPDKPLSTISATEPTTQSPAEYGQKLSKTVQQQLQISHGSKVTQTQTQISHSDEVIQNQTQINYGDRVNKQQDSESKQNQTQISHSSAVSQTQTQIDYGNKGMQTQLQIDHSKDSSQSQTQIHESTTSQTSTSKQSSNQNNECSESGFMGDNNDCKKFYRCVNSGNGKFTKYEYTCGDGTVWDQSIEACNHVWAVKDCGGQSHPVTQTSTVQTSTYLLIDTTAQTTTEAPEPDIDDIDVGYGNQGQAESSTSTSTTSTKTTSYYEEPHSDTTKAPQKEPNKNNECNSNGFMGDENDCKKFYRCVDNGMGGYTRHEFKCGEGTVWDSSIEACNHAWAVEKCGGNEVSSGNSQTSEQTTTQSGSETTIATTTMAVDKNTDEPISTTTSSSTSESTTTEANKDNVCKSSGFMGDSKNCKKFYRCVDNGDGTYTRHEFTCGEGTVWDSKIEACNHEWAVENCGGNSEPTTSTSSSTSQQSTLQDEYKENEVTTTQGYDSGTTTQSPSLTTTMGNDISSSDETCTESGFVGDKRNCKKFYRCVDNGKGGYDRYEFTCGEGTVWDASISACNHAWAVKDCDAGNTSSSQNGESTSAATVSTTESEKEESSQHTTEKSTSTTGSTNENEVTEGDCESEGFFGSLIDCKKFIRCVDDGKGGFTKYEFTCGEGTTWNPHISACDHPSPDRPCGQDYQSTTKESNHINDEMDSETTTTKMTSTTSGKEESESGVTQKPSPSSACNSEGFYADPSDCKKFYRCVDNGEGGYTKYEFTCGDGTVWNQEILACDHESDDKSCLSSGPKPTEATQSQSSTSESQSESTTSSSSTTTSSEETNKTEPPASTSNDKCTSAGFFAHPQDCKKFVRCVDNGNGGFTKYEFSCGEGTMWVQEIQACDHDNEDTKCKNQNDSNTKPHNDPSSSTTESGYSSSTEGIENQTQSKDDDEYPTTKGPTNTESDECTSEGYFGNQNDCRKFYRCVDNGQGGYTKYDFVCGEGTAWDSNIGNCNHINEVETCTNNNGANNQGQQTMKDEEMSQTTESTSSTTQSTTSSSSEPNGEAGSGSNTEGTDKCESEGYHGDSKDCKKFYRCVDDGKGGLTKYDFTCGEGTIWDQDITNCNHPQDVSNPSCKNGSEGTEEESQTSPTSSNTSSTTSSPESTSSSSSSDNTTQSSSNCTQEESSKKPASSKDIKCEKAGYYPNPNDCKKFYRCVDWDGDGKRFSVYHFECGEGTIWDPALDTCNHEESVYPPRDCSQTQAQTESSSETTTAKNQEETTTQESTTTEQSTTQESTTSEQTTEQEKTTTQQSTTSEKTTTEQSTTSEQTTTQQSTTSEQTTTQESTTSEQTTTQETTTSEQTTTQESTTSEQTTQESTTSEQTTQESTTSEQTTQESTTSEQTTQESTTSEQTTQESTTSEQTTQESTTSEQTTEESTTKQSTTEQTTQNNEQTESSTTEGTTEGSTTEEENNSTTEQSSTTEGDQQSTTESSSSSEKECPETEEDQYLFVCPTSFKRHPKYCNMFYQCTEDDDTHEVKIATFKCPNETIYDESKTQCVEEEKADKKCNGEMARRHRFKRLNRDSKEPITVDKGVKSCPSNGYFAFEENIECSSGFLKCAKNQSGKIRGYVHQCPDGYLFWKISKRCELASKIRDCKKSSNDWTGRWNIPVDRKNVAF